jgi:hypothetical protein
MPIKPVTLGPAGFAEALKEEPLPKRILGGVGSAVQSGIQSLKQLAGQPVPTHEITEQRALGSGPGMIGNIAGNVGMFALPAGKLAELVAASKFAPGVARFAAAPAVAAGEAAVLEPVLEGESRGANAAKAALFTKALQAGGRALTGLVKPSEQAQKLMAMDIQPTVGQGGSGALGKTMEQLENVAANLPLVGQWVKKGTARPHTEAMEVAAGRAQVPGLPAKAAPGRGEFFDELSDQHRVVQDALFQGKFASIRGDFSKNAISAALLELKDVPRGMVQSISRDLQDILPKNARRMSLERLNTAERQIREKIEQYAKTDSVVNNAAAKAYTAAADRISKLRDAHLTATETAQFADLQGRQAHGKILQKAASYTTEGSRDTSAHNLVKAVENITPAKVKVRGEGLYQDITEPFKKVLEKDAARDALTRRIAYAAAGLGIGAGGLAGSPLLATLGPALYAAAKAGTTRTGAKTLLGNTEAQKFLAELLRSRVAQGTMATIPGTSAQREE